MRGFHRCWMLLLLIMLVYIPMNDRVNAEMISTHETVIWDKTTEGPIYSYRIYDSDNIVDKLVEVGYADGGGNIFIKWYNLPPNQTLYIKPGVKIHITVDDPYNFVIYGGIIAEGSRNDPIIFTSNSSDPVWGDWSGIIVYPDFKLDTIFRFCIFQYGFEFYIERDFLMDHCEFYQTLGLDTGIKETIEDATVTNCTFIAEDLGKDLIGGLEITGIGKVIVNDNVLTSKYHIIQIFADEYLEFNRNEIQNGNIWASIGFYEAPVGYIVGNVVKGIPIQVFGNATIKDNDFETPLGLSCEYPPKLVRDNIFHEFIYYLDYDIEDFLIDLRYNTWNRDWNIEELSCIMNNSMREQILIDPYYDQNGTLTDSDSTPNGWEVSYGLDMYEYDSEMDPDSDGLTNEQEYLLNGTFNGGGLDPTDPDTDGDGADDGRELALKLDPFNNDTDDDDIFDGWELANGLDPADKEDGVEDPDNDTLTNVVEFTHIPSSLDPNDPDTDNDGLPDGWEMDEGLDPLVNDSYEDADNDNWTNLEEYIADTDIHDPISHPYVQIHVKPDYSAIFLLLIIFVLLLLLFSGLIYLIYRKKIGKKQNVLKDDKVLAYEIGADVQTEDMKID